MKSILTFTLVLFMALGAIAQNDTLYFQNFKLDEANWTYPSSAPFFDSRADLDGITSFNPNYNPIYDKENSEDWSFDNTMFNAILSNQSADHKTKTDHIYKLKSISIYQASSLKIGITLNDTVSQLQVIIQDQNTLIRDTVKYRPKKEWNTNYGWGKAADSMIVDLTPYNGKNVQITFRHYNENPSYGTTLTGGPYYSSGMGICSVLINGKTTSVLGVDRLVQNSSSLLRVYPNPSTGVINIYSESPVTITDLVGNVIKLNTNQVELKSGVYFVSNGSIVEKVIVK